MLVEWEDAAQDGGWRSRKVARKTKAEPTQSVGFIVKDGKHYLVIAQSMNEEDVGDTLTIPKGWITSVKTL